MSSRPPSSSSQILLAAATLLLACCAWGLTACQPVTFVLNAFEDDRIPARFTLDNGPVLVLVDDPQHHLGDPSLPDLVAAAAGQTIQANISKTSVVPVDKLAALRREKGSDFDAMAVTAVGQALGATQVVYVLVESGGITGDPGLYRPQATVRVNVLDVASGRRLFPAVDPDNPMAASQGPDKRGHAMNISLNYTQSEQSPIGETAVLMRALANEMGVQVAQLFFKHHPPRVPGYSDY